MFVNEGYASAYNRKKEEIIGKNVKDILEGNSLEVASKYLTRPKLGESVVFENTVKKKRW